MKKRIFACFLALLFLIAALTSCRKAPSDGSDSSSDASQAPMPDGLSEIQQFVSRLQYALQNVGQSEIDFDVREKHIYNDTTSVEKALFVKWTSDFSDDGHPRFSYALKRSLSAEKPEHLLFYENGFLYVKNGELRYRQPAELTQAIGSIPFDALTGLLGDRPAQAFADASVTKNADGSLTATATLSLADYAENTVAYLGGFGIEAGGIASNIGGTPSPLTVSVTMDADRIVSCTVQSTMQARNAQGGVYPVAYTVRAVYGEIGDAFAVAFPEGEARADYREAEAEMTEIDADAFLARFEKSDENADRALYTEMITNAAATYEMAQGYSVTVPLMNVTKIDLSDPKAPKIAMVETKDVMGSVRKTEIYYKDDTYYCDQNGYRFTMHYPAEDYLANVEASAQEKAESGITTMFLTRDMLENAVFTVGSDQSVTASVSFDGETQKQNIFYQILSLYNDDLAAMQNVVFLDARVTVTVDRFNDLRSYALCVSVSAESNGTAAVMHYNVQYILDYSEAPRAIDFPDDLESWGRTTA